MPDSHGNWREEPGLSSPAGFQQRAAVKTIGTVEKPDLVRDSHMRPSSYNTWRMSSNRIPRISSDPPGYPHCPALQN